jgi:UDP-N-acetylmuramate--alanine ligase
MVLRQRARQDNGNPIPQRVHLVGAGGIHMSAIGQILLQRGHTVTGSDLAPSEYTQRLEALGGTVYTGHAASNLGRAELLVVTAAAAPDNPEVTQAQARGIPVMSRAEMVQMLIADRDVLAVSGTHGKTTTASMLTLTAVEGGLDPLVLLGGDARDLGDTNARDGAGRHAIVEADEYAEAFLQYTPQIAVINNIEVDHLDYYGTPERYEAAFAAFAERVSDDGMLLVGIDTPRAAALAEARRAAGARVERTSVEDSSAEWYASRLRVNDRGGLDARVHLDGSELGALSLAVPGRYNMQNALGALAAGMRAGVDFHRAAAALSTFTGARRRFEVRGEIEAAEGPITVVDDYAHHPTEVRVSLAAAKQRYPGRRLIGVFQPHTYTRSSYLLEGFRDCFEVLDELVLLPTYAARETADRGLDAAALAAEIESPEPMLVDSFEEAVETLLDRLSGGDVCITLGAGTVTELPDLLLEQLEAAS